MKFKTDFHSCALEFSSTPSECHTLACTIDQTIEDEMQIAVISDLHLGSGDRSDAFGHRDAEFLRFLKQLEADFERIVLLGDVWEALTSDRPFDAVTGLRRARDAHPSIAERFRRRNYVYVHGNHDLVAASVDGAPGEWLLDSDGLRLVFSHGHHHDWLIRRARWLSESFVWLGAWARRVGCASVYRIGYWLDELCSRPAPHPGRDSFQNWALALARARSADVVVTGHTHIADVQRHQHRLFMNSGSCSEGKLSFLAIDTKTHQFDLCQAA